MGFVMTFIAQFVQARFEIRLVLAQFERRQHAAIVGAVAAVVEQRDVPVRAERVQELEQRARRFRELEAEQAFLERLGWTATDHVTHVQLRHLIVREIDHAVAAVVQQAEDLFALLHATAQTHADKNAGIFGVGKAVVELRYRTTAQQLAELEEAALLFRNRHRQQRFTLFAQLAALGNVAQAVEVHVRTREHVRQTFAANVVLGDVFLHPRQRQRAGRFRHRTYIFEQIFHRRADSVTINRDDIVEILLAQTERFVANALHRHALGEQPDARQIHRMSGVQRRLQAGRVFRFNRNHFDLRHQLFDQHRHTCG